MSSIRGSYLARTVVKKPNTPLKTSVVVLTALILSACSSSDGARSYTLDEIFNDSPTIKPTPEQPSQVPASVTANYADGAVTGMVINEAGQPIANAPVTVTLPDGKTVETITNADGKYVITVGENFKNGDKVIVSSGDKTEEEIIEGIEEPVTPDPDPKPDTTPAIVNANYADGILAGSVTNKDGEAVANAPVTITLPNGDTLETKTDADGNYTVEVGEDFTNGDKVTVTAGDVSAEEVIEGIEEPVTPDPDPKPDTTPAIVNANYADGILAGSVTNKDGEAVANAPVTITLPNGDTLETKTDADGNYTVEVGEDFTNGDKVTVTAGDVSAEEVIEGIEEPVTPDPDPEPAYSSPAESTLSGIQYLSIDTAAVTGAPSTVTTREFETRSSSDVDARADQALSLIKEPVAVVLSSDADTPTQNGYAAYEGTGSALSPNDLSYVSVYKDFDGVLKTAHVNGAVDASAVLPGLMVPVDGVLVVGNKTETLPTEGVFEYAGDATYRTTGAGNSIEYGSSVFTANFVNSQVDGTLKFTEAGSIALTADIDGNEFSGAAADNNGYNTEGAFYGEDAGYLGGIYEGNGAQGTYGAKKQ